MFVVSYMFILCAWNCLITRNFVTSIISSLSFKAAAREISTKRPSLFWSDSDKSGDKNEPLNESDERQNIPENVDDDNDEMVPHWFRQLEQQGVESAIEEFDTSFSLEVSFRFLFS